MFQLLQGCVCVCVCEAWIYSKHVQGEQLQARQQNREWVTNENLFYHRCFNFLSVVLNRDCALCPPLNRETCPHNKMLDAAVEGWQRSRSVVVVDTA